MDLQKIVESEGMEGVEKRLLNLDSEFRFKCRRCGKCCRNQREVMFTARDLYHIARKLEITTQTVINQYAEVYIGPKSRFPLVNMVPSGHGGTCPLQDREGHCTVHDCKPAVCALYPLGRVLLNAVPGEPLTSDADLRVRYILQEHTCGSAKRGHTVRSWLEKSGIMDEDQFFLDWNRVTLLVGETARRLEEARDIKAVRRLWRQAYRLLYIAYDTEEAFSPQFERNSQELKAFCIEMRKDIQEDLHDI